MKFKPIFTITIFVIIGIALVMIALDNNKMEQVTETIAPVHSPSSSVSNHANPAPVQEQDFVAKYAGTYYIKVDGVPDGKNAEIYFLGADGRADWMFTDGINKTVKSGKWYATENIININIQGNSGLITETYQLKNGIWKTGSRYLDKK